MKMKKLLFMAFFVAAVLCFFAFISDLRQNELRTKPTLNSIEETAIANDAVVQGINKVNSFREY